MMFSRTLSKSRFLFACLLVVAFGSQAQTGGIPSTANLCKPYKATIFFTTSNTRVQNCSDCGSPCPLIQDVQQHSQGNYTLVSDLCGAGGFYTMAAVEDRITRVSGSGSSSDASKSKACGDEERVSGNYSYGIDPKPEFQFQYNGPGAWSASFSVAGKGIQSTADGEVEQEHVIGITVDPTQGKLTYDKNKFTITGSFVIDESNDNTRTTDKTDVNFTITLEPFQSTQLMAVIEPVDSNAYKKWLPQAKLPGYADFKPENDSLLGFRVRILDRNDHFKDVTLKYPFQVAFHLFDVSHYKGVCSNFPAAAQANEDPDLQWDLGKVKQNSKLFSKIDDQYMTSLPENGFSVVAWVMAKDFGAYGKLNAELTLADGRVLQAESPMYPGQTGLTIPMDKNANKIADEWEANEQILWQNKPFTDDFDKLPDNGNLGDDYCLVDEYRGFIVERAKKKAFLRFSPQHKDFMVAAEGTHLADIGLGALNFGTLTGIKVYTLHAFTDLDLRQTEPSQESKFPRWVNFNSPVDRKSYCVVVTANDIMDHNSEASANNLHSVPDGNGDYYPREMDYITLRLPRIHDIAIVEKAGWYNSASHKIDPEVLTPIDNANRLYHYHIKADSMRPVILRNTDTLVNRFIRYTVTHELGHATHVPHHNCTVPESVDPWAYYKNDIHCPMRYWYSDFANENNFDWMVSFLALAWNPCTLKLPDGKPYQFCTSTDDCWHKLALRPPLK